MACPTRAAVNPVPVRVVLLLVNVQAAVVTLPAPETDWPTASIVVLGTVTVPMPPLGTALYAPGVKVAPVSKPLLTTGVMVA